MFQMSRLVATAFSLIFGLGLAGCSNYSGESQTVNPAIIFPAASAASGQEVGIEAEGTGHIIRVRLNNSELGFSGYRLFVATTEAAVRALADDSSTLDCNPFTSGLTLNQSVIYIIEVKPGQTEVTAGLTDNRICAIDATLTSGQFVQLRTLVTAGLTTSVSSAGSNVVQVP